MIKIGAVFIPVTNMEKSAQWYQEKLGLNPIGAWPDGNGADFYFTEEKQYVTLIKVKKMPPTTFPDITDFQNSYFNFTTADVHALHTELKQKGVHVSEVEDHGAITGFDFYDLDGNTFSVIIDS
ncbi:VOC family protein [Virgibacillus sp. AGTR]|uniref:VOC family protein n=1 Tax=unclassified Virgibacillus TaxID=2620237 RepID=UPI000EF4840A|nr:MULTISPECIES: VOC family protein [unclassified Virgibacillus]MCC2252339.1 VOC family protein [Virgibacillus sp. AGTR]MDY7044881.1 VOC family protein [Virgibacillus sp. M23]QRZ18907.1 VOC family protein [Virgibacillus sp. AGTR]